MKQQVIITKTIIGWYNIKDTNHNLLLNVSPEVFEKNFSEVNNDVQIAVIEMDLSRITEIKNKEKVGI